MTASDPAALADYRGLFSLAGKVAVVTGACGILGRHFCAALAGQGATVAAVDLDTMAVGELAARLSAQFGTLALGLTCDVADGPQVSAMTERTVEQFGRIDVLLNNAATKTSDIRAFMQPAEAMSLRTWRETMAVNLDGVFLVAQAVGNRMRAQRSGSIIQTASIYGVVGPDLRIYEGSYYLGGAITNPASYSASKAGVIGLTRHLATAWAADGVRVNALVPGGVESGQNETFKARYSARVPLGRMARPGELVGAVIWLASDAASYVTGQVVAVDGGLTAW
jgi:NAD(P)-dependent dehydrogenase (short-subunit alcohol dehydrogenase family)